MNWEEKENKLYKRFTFKDFKEALNFVNKVGVISEKLNHHPNITFSYGFVEIYIYSHDVNEITDRDYELSQKIDKITF